MIQDLKNYRALEPHSIVPMPILGLAMLLLILAAGYMEATDIEPPCEIRPVDHGRESVKVCGAKSKPPAGIID